MMFVIYSPKINVLKNSRFFILYILIISTVACNNDDDLNGGVQTFQAIKAIFTFSNSGFQGCALGKGET